MGSEPSPAAVVLARRGSGNCPRTDRFSGRSSRHHRLRNFTGFVGTQGVRTGARENSRLSPPLASGSKLALTLLQCNSVCKRLSFPDREYVSQTLNLSA